MATAINYETPNEVEGAAMELEAIHVEMQRLVDEFHEKAKVLMAAALGEDAAAELTR